MIQIIKNLNVVLTPTACRKYVDDKTSEIYLNLFWLMLQKVGKEKQVKNFLQSKNSPINVDNVTNAINWLEISLGQYPNVMLEDFKKIFKKIRKRVLIFQISFMTCLYAFYIAYLWYCKPSAISMLVTCISFGFFVGYFLSLVFRKIEADIVSKKMEEYISMHQVKKAHLRKV